MKIMKWIEQNRASVNWKEILDLWDQMQLVHNPFRNDQIETIYHLSGVQNGDRPKVLDLGCGPGTLAKRFWERKADVEFVCVDIDLFMLEVFRNTSELLNATILQKDIKSYGWPDEYMNHFDAVISLTSIHWLSQQHQKELYRNIYKMLKIGGIFLNGDPYLPASKEIGNRLAGFQNEHSSKMKGQKWDEFWDNVYARYGIREHLHEMRQELGYWENIAGSDDGHTIDARSNPMQITSKSGIVSPQLR